MRKQRLLTASITAMLLLGILAVLPVMAPTGTSVYIDPALVERYTNTTDVSDTFTVALKFGNFTDLAGIEYKLFWDNSVLELISIVDTLPWTSVYVGANSTNNNWNATHGRSYFVAIDTGGAPFTGSATLRTMTFNITGEPAPGFGNFAYSLIDIRDTIFGDSGANPIAHTVYDGEFYFYYVMPAKWTITAGSFTATFEGQTFSLPVTISDVDAVWDLAYVYFELTYNTTLLDALSITEGTFFSSFGTTTFSSNINDAGGIVDVTIQLTSGGPPSGSGTLAEIQFNGTYGEVGNILTSPLHLQNVVCRDSAAVDIGYQALVDGLYTMAIPSPALKAISVQPPVTTVFDEGVLFSINIWVHNVSSVDKLFGVQFTLDFDHTLIELISVAEGPFFGGFPWTPAPPYTYMFVYPGTGTVTVATGLLGGGAEPPGYIYPNGNGSIATITFKSIYGIPGSTIGCALDLHSVIFGDVNALPIPVGLVHDGEYFITLDKRYIDIYTQYSSPFGGQKRFHDADAYAPQAEVIVSALVTYNRWPVQNKLVEFEIHGPPNPIENITLFRVATTDANGIATISFRVDWPCDDPETVVFGTWTVYGAVDLDEIKVYDILHFEAGWLVDITKITLNEAEYRHGWHMTVWLEYESISAQLRDVVFTVTIYDDAGYGLGSMTLEVTVSKGTGTVELTCFWIPKWARAGVATAYANAFTDYPMLSGVPYGSEEAENFIILAL